MNMMGKPQDKCITLTAKVTSPDGKKHDSVMRNCSSSMMCNMICSRMPNVADCKASCCVGNLCNKVEDGTNVPSDSVTNAPNDSVKTMGSTILVFLLVGLIARF
jgi:hypothetical protein